jgi:cobalt-precorrin 5A hydrolase
MDLEQAMIVAGIGCRKGTSPEEIRTVIASALAQAGVSAGDLAVIATATSKGTEPGIVAAAASLGVRLTLVPQDALLAAGPATKTYSARSIATMGVASVAEAAALAAAGPAARLLAARIAVGPATCALAAGAP